MSKSKIIPHFELEPIEKLNRQKIIWNACARSCVRNYTYNDYNKKVITNLLYYFNGQEKEYDLNKGIMLSGSFGVGKSMIFKIFHKYISITGNPNVFRIESIETLKNHYQQEKHFNYFNEYKPSLQRYGINICINEFGIDYDLSVYGVKFAETFNSFLMHRYELFVNKGLITHATTNMNSIDLSRKYDPALTSRFAEMFNIISLDGESFRK